MLNKFYVMAILATLIPLFSPRILERKCIPLKIEKSEKVAGEKSFQPPYNPLFECEIFFFFSLEK